MAKLAPLPANSVVAPSACVGAEMAPLQPDNTRKQPVEQPAAAALSPPGLTDGSMSEAATPRADEEDDASPSTPLIGEDDEEEEVEKETPEEEETVLVPMRTPAQERRVALTFDRATQVLSDLAREQAEAKAHVDAKIVQVSEGRMSLVQLRNHCAKLKSAVKEARRVDKMRKRVQRVMEARAVDAEDANEDEDGHASIEEDRKAIRKAIKRLKRQQDEHALRFQLLMSENQRLNMKLENQMTELRREYADSYLFPGVQLG